MADKKFLEKMQEEAVIEHEPVELKDTEDLEEIDLDDSFDFGEVSLDDDNSESEAEPMHVEPEHVDEPVDEEIPHEEVPEMTESEMANVFDRFTGVSENPVEEIQEESSVEETVEDSVEHVEDSAEHIVDTGVEEAVNSLIIDEDVEEPMSIDEKINELCSYIFTKIMENIKTDFTSTIFTREYMGQMIDSFLEGEMKSNDPLFASLLDEVLDSEYEDVFFCDYTKIAVELIKASEVGE